MTYRTHHSAHVVVALFGSFEDNKPITDPYYGNIVNIPSLAVHKNSLMSIDIPPVHSCRVASKTCTLNACDIRTPSSALRSNNVLRYDPCTTSISPNYYPRTFTSVCMNTVFNT